MFCGWWFPVPPEFSVGTVLMLRAGRDDELRDPLLFRVVAIRRPFLCEAEATVVYLDDYRSGTRMTIFAHEIPWTFCRYTAGGQ